jgi:hypothetical protein
MRIGIICSLLLLASCKTVTIVEPPAEDITPETLIAEASQSLCSALLRCCDTASEDIFFAPYNQNDVFLDLRPLIPPQAELTAETCPGVVSQLLERRPFGAWIAAVERGEVGFDEAAAINCVANLDAATCGDEATAALFDASCFAFGPPLGGEEEREIFLRTDVAGAACTALDDGFGGAFFGTCDPFQAFCCKDEGNGCAIPAPGDAGVCQTVSQEGEACSFFPTLQLCATGLDCDDNDLCVAPNTTPLQTGDTCIDANLAFLGECVDSFCDLFGTSLCTALGADGASCTAGFECEGGACNANLCAQSNICVGI